MLAQSACFHMVLVEGSTTLEAEAAMASYVPILKVSVLKPSTAEGEHAKAFGH